MFGEMREDMEYHKTKATFKEIEHTADIGLSVEGDSLGELFANAAYGLIYLLFNDRESEEHEIRYIEITENRPDELLITWLSEINYYISVHNFSPISIRDLDIKKTADRYHLHAEVAGGYLPDPATEIKAITYHQFFLKKNRSDHYQARIIFDI